MNSDSAASRWSAPLIRDGQATPCFDKLHCHGTNALRGICRESATAAPLVHGPDPSMDSVFGPLTSGSERGTG